MNIDVVHKKVSDFGLSRIYEDGTYSPSGATSLPMKWCSPEMITKKQMSFESDIWMFGGSTISLIDTLVTIWELYSFGEIPYSGLTPLESAQSIVAGIKLEIPTNAPSGIGYMLSMCWRSNVKERPAMRELLANI